jgi:hypothetical protein
MTAFNQKPFADRWVHMGSTAERSVEEAHEGKVVRFGLDRPPFSLRYLPAELRGAPDYLGGKAFYEACGVGRDQMVKIKVYKHNTQMWWNDIFPVFYHIFDSANKRWAEIEVTVVQELIDAGHVPIKKFDSDNIEYYELNMELVMANATDGGPTK